MNLARTPISYTRVYSTNQFARPFSCLNCQLTYGPLRLTTPVRVGSIQQPDKEHRSQRWLGHLQYLLPYKVSAHLPAQV
jgi:hypothetical protein